MAKNEVTPNVPQIPLDATPSNIPTEPTQLRHMLGWALQAQEPADSILSALATLGLSEAAYKNNLGTPRPSEVMVGLDKSNTYLYLVPVRPNTTGATPVKHNGGRCSFNLYITFAKLDRLVQPGIREYYDVKPTPGEVTIGAVKGWGLYINLTEVKKEPISRLSEEERVKRAEKRRKTLAAKKAAKEANRESAPGAENPEE